jgi:hypothetical protein
MVIRSQSLVKFKNYQNVWRFFRAKSIEWSVIVVDQTCGLFRLNLTLHIGVEKGLEIRRAGLTRMSSLDEFGLEKSSVKIRYFQ